MSRTISRIAGVIISLVFVIALFPGFKIKAAEIVDQGECGGNNSNVTWTLDSDGTLTISGKGKMKDWNQNTSPFFENQNIKKVVIEDGVTSIGSDAFSDCTSLTSITIPNSVTSIGSWAFASCKSLTSITIPNSVTSIGTGAFADCYSFTSITIPNSVTSIVDYAFYGCMSLTSITIPNSVTSICKNAFRDCYSLTSITIPNSVTSIGNGAFEKCSSLTSIIIDREVYEKTSSAFNGISSDTFHFYYDATYTTSTAGGSISGNAKTYGTDEITIKPDQHYSVDKVVLTVKDKNGNDVEKELSPVNGKYLMPDYDFDNWTGDCKVIASFKVVEYEITFKNYDDTVLEAKKVKAGETPTYTGKVTPTKPSVGGDAYEFAGWDPFPGAVTGPATYIAVYNKTEAKYTVTFVDNDGVVIYRDTVKYHEVPVFKGNTTPVREETDTHKFTFAGWTDGKTTYSLDQGLPQIESDTTFSPVFDPVVKPVYTVGEVKGDRQTAGQNTDLVVEIKRSENDAITYDHFTGVKMDGRDVPEKDASGKANWTAAKGSLVLTVKSTYMETLAAGDHTLKVLFKDGSVEIPVTISAAETSPKTGDASNLLLWSVLALLSLAGIAALTASKASRKKRQ